MTSEWQRDRPNMGRSDYLTAGAWLTVLVISIELMRSFNVPSVDSSPVWLQYLLMLIVGVLVVARRRYPIGAALAAAVVFWIGVAWTPLLGSGLTFQLVCFYLLYSAIAWARDRRVMLVVLGAIMMALWLWLGVTFATGNAFDQMRSIYDEHGEQPSGPLSPTVSYVLFTLLVNTLYVLGAAGLGVQSWRQARGREIIEEQSRTITEQSDALRDQAVTDERLRIARELHDVVAHHVSVMGIQAAAARRILACDPSTASEALVAVEQSSREAIAQMRGLLGSLRGITHDSDASRAPEPTLGQLEELIDSFSSADFRASLARIERPAGAADMLALPAQLALYRTVEEALANVRQHSTARSATVTLRVDREANPGFAEVEILDEGRPRGATSGTGMGQLGMRERVASLHGVIEVGPRVTGGYRVRARLPITAPGLIGLAG